MFSSQQALMTTVEVYSADEIGETLATMKTKEERP